MKDIKNITAEESKEIISRWLEIISTNEVNQITGYLTMPRKGERCYCVMGALGLALTERDYLSDSSEQYFTDNSGEIIKGAFDNDTIASLGIDFTVNEIGDRFVDKLMYFNDSLHYTFNELTPFMAEHLTRQGLIRAE